MRSYKAARRAAKREEGGEPIPFEVTYYNEADEEVTETFNAYGEASGATLADFTAAGAESADIRKTFEELIGDADEFARLWRTASFMNMEDLSEILQGLIEDTTGRPTKQPSNSPVLSSTTGRSSRVVVLEGGFLTEAKPIESHDEALPVESSA